MPSNNREVAIRTSGPIAILNRSLPKYFSVDEVHAIIEQATNPRDHLLLNCLWQTGARISEMLQLKPGDIDFTAGTVRLVTLKRRARFERAVLVKSPLLGELARHVASKRIQDGQRIFSITRFRAHQIVRKACAAAGITDKRAHPHTFRHSLGVFLIQRLPVTALKEILGHASIESSVVYSRLVAQDVRKYYEGIDF